MRPPGLAVHLHRKRGWEADLIRHGRRRAQSRQALAQIGGAPWATSRRGIKGRRGFAMARERWAAKGALSGGTACPLAGAAGGAEPWHTRCL